MAWVQLKNLFEDDKNLYGLLDKDIKGTLVLSDLLVKLGNDTFLKDFNAKYANREVCVSELMNDKDINGPEWCLNKEGQLRNYQGSLVEIDGELVFPTLMTMDILPWLRKQSVDKLGAIADCICTNWDTHIKEGNKAPAIYHPKFNELGNRVRNISEYRSFMELCS